MVYCAMENVANLLYILHLSTNKVLINVLQAYIVMLIKVFEIILCMYLKLKFYLKHLTYKYT
jgi:hypothetical protein